MNILYDLQLSVLTSLNDGNFLFQTDSNVNICTFTIKSLLEKNSNYHFYVLVPEKDKLVNSNFVEDLNDDRITFIEYPYFGNPFVERMSFNARVLMNALKDVKIDLVFANDICKVLSYKTFFYMKQNEFIKIISNNQWVTGKIHRKVPTEIDFVIRQTESILYSDYVITNSNAAINFILENAKEHFNKDVISKIKNKLIAIYATDTAKINKFKPTESKKDSFVFTFPHRLSYYTGFEEVFSVLEELYQEKYQFCLLAPDPGNKFSQKELKAKYPFLKEIDKENWDHNDYLRSCWEADVVIGNHNVPTTWGGLALTEPMSAETAPAMPMKDGYLEMFYHDKEVYFNNRGEMKKLLKRYLVDTKFLSEKKMLASKYCREELSIDRYANVVNDLILKACTS